MRSMNARLAAIALPLVLAACASIPRPNILGDLDRVGESPAAVEAKRYAPDAFARAEKIRGEAKAAFDRGDIAGSEILAERAIAAYSHASALARVARADATAVEAKAALTAAEADVTGLDADQQRVGADADALELKVKVARDAQPIQPSGKADPERERARVAAARSLAMEARMLCGAAKLLVGMPGSDDKQKAQLDEAEAALTKIEADLSAPQIPAVPIDGATRARAGCLAALTVIRRAASPTSRATGAGDALLAAISATKSFTPARDDRGVAVPIRGAFSGSALSAQGEAKLVELGKIAAANASFPIEIVVHSDRPVSERDETAAKTLGDLVTKALSKGSAKPRTLVVVAGEKVPVADPKGPDRARNARIEIVFITPETF